MVHDGALPLARFSVLDLTRMRADLAYRGI
jgi:hypothetical protein